MSKKAANKKAHTTSNPPWRPTDYKPEYCQMLIDHMATGLSFTTFAAVIDVNRDTLYNWVNLFPAFSDAKRQAFDKCQLFWEKIGQEGVWNRPFDKTINSAIWIYNMKCRFPKDWRDKEEPERPTDQPSAQTIQNLLEQAKALVDKL